MPLCFIEPHDAIRVIAESVGREARRQLVSEVYHAWVDEIPERELVNALHPAVSELDDEDLSMLAAWHASLETVGQPIANTDFLVSIYPSLGEHRREALKVAAGLGSEEAFDAGRAEEHALAGDPAAPLADARRRARERVRRALHVGSSRQPELSLCAGR
jgi:hypothetical protein